MIFEHWDWSQPWWCLRVLLLWCFSLFQLFCPHWKGPVATLYIFLDLILFIVVHVLKDNLFIFFKEQSNCWLLSTMWIYTNTGKIQRRNQHCKFFKKNKLFVSSKCFIWTSLKPVYTFTGLFANSAKITNLLLLH